MRVNVTLNPVVAHFPIAAFETNLAARTYYFPFARGPRGIAKGARGTLRPRPHAVSW